jgi:hypothetical protein
MRKTSGRLTAALGATLLIAGGSLTATPALAAAPASAIAPAASTSGVSTATGLSASEGFLMLVAVRPAKVTVPSNYVYDPKLGPRHDYCTDAPDEFPAPRAANADFRGPCARHDLCYDGSASKKSCDKALRRNMFRNCEHYYGKYAPLRAACKVAALTYWAAVVATGDAG